MTTKDTIDKLKAGEIVPLYPADGCPSFTTLRVWDGIRQNATQRMNALFFVPSVMIRP